MTNDDTQPKEDRDDEVKNIKIECCKDAPFYVHVTERIGTFFNQLTGYNDYHLSCANCTKKDVFTIGAIMDANDPKCEDDGSPLKVPQETTEQQICPKCKKDKFRAMAQHGFKGFQLFSFDSYNVKHQLICASCEHIVEAEIIMRMPKKVKTDN